MAQHPKDLVFVRYTGPAQAILGGHYIQPGETREVPRYQVTEALRFHPGAFVIKGDESEPQPDGHPENPPAAPKADKPSPSKVDQKNAASKSGKGKPQSAAPKVEQTGETN